MKNVLNNATNDNWTCCIVSNSLSTDNIKVDNLSIEKQGEKDCCTAQWTCCIVSNSLSTDKFKVDNLPIFDLKQLFRLLEIGIQNSKYKIME